MPPYRSPLARFRRHALSGLRLLSACLIVLGSVACNKSQDGVPPSPVPTPGTPVTYAAIGASDAIGYGSSAPCLPLASCPEGHGYVQLVARELGADGTTVTVTNLGLPATVLSPGIQAIRNQYGRNIPGNFLEGEMPFVPRASTLVTIFAGGNDTNAIGTAVKGGAGGGDPNGYIDQQVRAFASAYRALVRGIRARAPSARIVAMNLPNMAGLPYAAAFTTTERRYLQRISVGFTRDGANTLTSEGVAVVDLLCNPRSYDPSSYSGDGFHPNDAGYAFLASELLRAIRTAGYQAPQGDCGFMRIVS